MENPGNILFIKLGEKGSYEQCCIDNEKIKIGYHEVNHGFCIAGNWDLVNTNISEQYIAVKTATTIHKNQVKRFYEEPKTTMWITFYK
jgi:hypothetical protein